MTAYCFDECLDRTCTDSVKWSPAAMEKRFHSADCLPLWIADMDFKTAPPIIEALKQRAAHGIFGYGWQSDAFLSAVVSWQKRRNNWDIQKEWILFTPGIIPALNFIVQSFCHPGDHILLQSPVYHPFYNIIEANGCHVADNALLLKNGQYEINFTELEHLAADSRTTLMLLCSPHNPIGRVWKKEELLRIGDICMRHHVLLVADEIHSDLIYPPYRHFPLASLSPELAQHSIVCTSPSKTFNMAGLQVSDIIVPNDHLRSTLANTLKKIDIEPGSFAAVAQIAAYQEGEEWLEQLLAYLQDNLRCMEQFIKEKMPLVSFTPPQATYLAWLDFSRYQLSDEALQNILLKKAKVLLNSGSMFKKGMGQYQRINIACPRSRLLSALQRMEQALRPYAPMTRY